MPERKEKILTHFKHTCHERKNIEELQNLIILYYSG